MFITLEGPDGAGKTTQAAWLVERLRGEGHDVVALREPGGTDLGAVVREILVRRNWTPIDARAEALLFAACRAQLVSEVIRPALARGSMVVADRFADSTRAYQGAGRGLPAAELESLIAFATGGIAPELTLLLDVPVVVGRSRLEPPPMVSDQRQVDIAGVTNEADTGEGWNRFEDEAIAFHERVRSAYLELAKREPHRWIVVDASQSPEMVRSVIWETVSNAIGSSSQAEPMAPSPLEGEGWDGG